MPSINVAGACPGGSDDDPHGDATSTRQAASATTSRRRARRAARSRSRRGGSTSTAGAVGELDDHDRVDRCRRRRSTSARSASSRATAGVPDPAHAGGVQCRSQGAVDADERVRTRPRSRAQRARPARSRRTNTSFDDTAVDLTTSVDQRAADHRRRRGERDRRPPRRARPRRSPACRSARPSVAPGRARSATSRSTRSAAPRRPDRRRGDHQLQRAGVRVQRAGPTPAIGVDSNGYLVVGGGTSEDNNCCNLPDRRRPGTGRTTSWRRSGPTSTAPARPASCVDVLTDGVDTLDRRRVAGQRVRHHRAAPLPDLDRRQRRRGHHLRLRPRRPDVGERPGRSSSAPRTRRGPAATSLGPNVVPTSGPAGHQLGAGAGRRRLLHRARPRPAGRHRDGRRPRWTASEVLGTDRGEVHGRPSRPADPVAARRRRQPSTGGSGCSHRKIERAPPEWYS